MDEAGLCDRIALIQSGKILSVNTPEQIIKEYPYPLYAMKSDDNYKLLKEMKARKEVRTCYIFGEYLHVTFQKEKINRVGTEIMEIQPGIEDCFIQLMDKNESNNN
jgi:ABC-type multidrug transport system ATPase subunit